MKHAIPLTLALSFSLWTGALLLYQKRTILKALRSEKTKGWILKEVAGMIDRIIPDLAMPFIPQSLLNKLKNHGSDEAIKKIPLAENLIGDLFKKYIIPALILSFFLGLLLSYGLVWLFS